MLWYNKEQPTKDIVVSRLPLYARNHVPGHLDETTQYGASYQFLDLCCEGSCNCLFEGGGIG